MPTAAVLSSSMPRHALTQPLFRPDRVQIPRCWDVMPCDSYTWTGRLQQIATEGLGLSSKCPRPIRVTGRLSHQTGGPDGQS